MAGLVRPRRALIVPRTYRKPLRPTLDKADPINRNQVAFYACNENQNSPLFDLSPLAGHAAPNSGPIAPALGSYGGNAPNLQGSGQSYTNPGSIPVTGTGFTFYTRFWDISSGFTNPRVLSINDSAVVLTQFTGSNRICVSGDAGTHTIDCAFTPQVWNDFIWTCDAAGNSIIYLNGVQMASGFTEAIGDTGPVGFGDRSSHGGDRVWPGKFDCIRIWNRIITDAERARLSAWPWAGAYGNELPYLVGATGSPDITLSLTGNSATGSVGTLTPTRGITGNAATGSVGSVSPGISIALTGNSATGAVGSVSTTGDKTIALSGNAATSGLGSVSPGLSKALSGNSATGAVGTLSRSSLITLGLTGNQAASGLGTLGVAGDKTISLTGNSATGFVGSMTATFPFSWTPQTPNVITWTGTVPVSTIWTPQ